MGLLEEIRTFYNGNSYSAYSFLGCHKTVSGYVFRLWAPNARKVFLTGDFNSWDRLEMDRVEGIWEIEVLDAKDFDCYKYVIETMDGNFIEKCDPYAYHTETRPATASKIYDIESYKWNDEKYLSDQLNKNPYRSPINIYEVHLGSWKRYKDNEPFEYTKLADELVKYVKEMGYTHIELLPVTEYPFDGSWGYQVTGWYAPTSRYGSPDDFKYFVDSCHKEGIGVILDWVGAHFPKDNFGLPMFDGTPCYESSDKLMAEHPEWGTKIFDYSRNEVRSFLTSSVCFWLDKYHIDGIRVDAVASFIYLDYSRKEGQWHPASDGSNINHAAIDFLRFMNTSAFKVKPSVLMIAEDSTAFPQMTKPPYDGGLGFGFKWNMGWMHDTLDYFSTDPIFRKWDHSKLTFSLTYAFSENFILPFSHDEVVHGKRSLIGRMPGSYEDKFRTLRVMYAFMYSHPGKKLNFMGNEFGQFIEWDYHKELDWLLLQYDEHISLQEYCKGLNHFYLNNPPFWDIDDDWRGFKWVKVDDADNSILAFERISQNGDVILALFNFLPVKVDNYMLGFSEEYKIDPVFASDLAERKTVYTEEKEFDGQKFSAEFEIEPLSATFYNLSPHMSNRKR